MTPVNQERLRAALKAGFREGQHEENGEQKFCVMEAAAWIAGEPWSDHPRCVCPVIATFCRSWNDTLPASDRDRLLGPLLPALIGTTGAGSRRERRAWMAADWLIRECAASFLDLTPSLAEHGARLRGLAEVTGEKEDAVREAIKQAREAALNAALGMSRGNPARAAGAAAAWDATSRHAVPTTTEALWVARDAAWAAGPCVGPVVAKLQESAVQLVRRMAKA